MPMHSALFGKDTAQLVCKLRPTYRCRFLLGATCRSTALLQSRMIKPLADFERAQKEQKLKRLFNDGKAGDAR